MGHELSAGPPQAKFSPRGGKCSTRSEKLGAISLRRYLLLGILMPVGMLLIINTVSLYQQALGAVNTAYDRTLPAWARSIGEQLDVSGYD